MSSKPRAPFDYKGYWDQNYAQGGTSGSGSYGVLAEFKAEVIQDLVDRHQLERVIEFGCGDGHQLSLLNYPQYLGLDVAYSSIDLCMKRFADDPSKSFLPYDPRHFWNKGFLRCDLVVCLDVLYHITDDFDFKKTLDDMFSCDPAYLVLYTRITRSDEAFVVSTIQDRDILQHLQAYPQYEIERIIKQRYPHMSSADFIILKRKEATQ